MCLTNQREEWTETAQNEILNTNTTIYSNCVVEAAKKATWQRNAFTWIMWS